MNFAYSSTDSTNGNSEASQQGRLTVRGINAKSAMGFVKPAQALLRTVATSK